MNQVPTTDSILGRAPTEPASGAAPRIGFVKARWHARLVDACHEGFLREIARLADGRAQVRAVGVPGAFEIPLMVRRLAESGRFDVLVGAAFVVDGGIYRHEFVSAAVLDGLMRVQLDCGLPVLSAVLTPHHFQDGDAQQRFFLEHLAEKGREVAGACLGVLAAHREAACAA